MERTEKWVMGTVCISVQYPLRVACIAGCRIYSLIVFTELMEKKVQDKDHFIIQQVMIGA